MGKYPFEGAFDKARNRRYPTPGSLPYPIVTAVAEDKHCRFKRIADMLKVYDSGKAVYPFAHIGRAQTR